MKLIILIYAFLHHFSFFWCNAVEISENSTHFLDQDNKTNESFMQENISKYNTDGIIRLYQLNDTRIFTNITDSITFGNTDTAPMTSNHDGNKKIEDKDVVFELKNLIYDRGCLRLETLGNKILNYKNNSIMEQNYVNWETYLFHIFQDYMDELDAYLETIGYPKHKRNGRKMYFFDIIESCNIIFARESLKVFNYAMKMTSGNVQKNHPVILKRKMQQANDAEKKNNLEYICNKFNICRFFPTYSDHVAGVLAEIIKLPQEPFIIISTSFNNIIKNNMPFLKSIMNNLILKIIRSKLTSLALNTSDSMSFLSAISNNILRRYKIIRNEDESIKKRIKAANILIDMVDKAFENLGNDFVESEFIAIKNNLGALQIEHMYNDRDMIQMAIDNIKSINKAINKMIRVLKIYWDPEILEEAKILIDYIVTGTSEKIDDLFANGSKFVRDHNAFLLYSEMFSTDVPWR